MKSILMAVALVSSLLVSGCSPSPEQLNAARAANTSSIQHPDVFGKLPDGREIKRVIIVTPYGHDHYVYFVDNAVVSANYQEQNGKTTIDRVRVTISPNSTAADIISLADDLKKQQKSADTAEYNRLKQQLGY